MRGDGAGHELSINSARVSRACGWPSPASARHSTICGQHQRFSLTIGESLQRGDQCRPEVNGVTEHEYPLHVARSWQEADCVPGEHPAFAFNAPRTVAHLMPNAGVQICETVAMSRAMSRPYCVPHLHKSGSDKVIRFARVAHIHHGDPTNLVFV
jgi:hypothetical protein